MRMRYWSSDVCSSDLHPPKSLHLDARSGDGSTFEAELEFAQASYEGEPCLQIIFRQRASDPDLERKYAELRERDALTGLYNRQHFPYELDNTVAKTVERSPDQAVLFHVTGRQCGMERGGQSVWDSGGACSYKKNKN